GRRGATAREEPHAAFRTSGGVDSGRRGRPTRARNGTRFGIGRTPGARDHGLGPGARILSGVARAHARTAPSAGRKVSRRPSLFAHVARGGENPLHRPPYYRHRPYELFLSRFAKRTPFRQRKVAPCGRKLVLKTRPSATMRVRLLYLPPISTF